MRDKVFHIRLLPFQMELLEDCSRLTKQSKSDLVREAIVAHLYPLYDRLKKQATERGEDEEGLA